MGYSVSTYFSGDVTGRHIPHFCSKMMFTRIENRMLAPALRREWEEMNVPVAR